MLKHKAYTSLSTDKKLTNVDQGFTNDIGAKASDLNLAVSLFFITFVLFQPISSAVGRRIGAKHWIPVIMLGWGVLTICHAFIHGRGELPNSRTLPLTAYHA